jgi:hypothetical protein
MNEHPILFSGEMVTAILDGRKTLTRRVVKNSPCTCGNPPGVSDCKLQNIGANQWACGSLSYTGEFVRCPYGRIGDRLWVRETLGWESYATNGLSDLWYISDHKEVDADIPANWEPPRNAIQTFWESGDSIPGGGFSYSQGTVASIFMPRWASRITLEITNIRVERLQDISDDDAKAEGIQPNAGDCGFGCECCELPTTIFARLWDKINGKKYPWDSNPYVWVLEFKKI